MQFPARTLSSDPGDIDRTFVLWVRPFLECALRVARSCRDLGDQDEVLLCLAAWHFLLSDIAASRDVLSDIGDLPAREGLARIDPARFPASPVAALVEATGIPRETVRRKLVRLARRSLLAARPDGTIQLAAAHDHILAVAPPAVALARWLLAIHGWPPDALGELRSLGSFIALVRRYLAVYVSLVKSRRVLTGTVSLVSVQLGVNLQHVHNIEALLAAEGPPAAWDFEAFVSLSRQVFDEPCYVRPIAGATGLSLAEVRAGCRRLATGDGFITMTGAESFVVGGGGYSRESVGSRRLYADETRDALHAFARRVIEDAARQPGAVSPARASCPPAPTAGR